MLVVVRQLLASGACVVVPSRSEEKIKSLRNHLNKFVEVRLNNLHTFKGTIGDESVSIFCLKKS